MDEQKGFEEGDALRLLMEVAYASAGHGFHREAERITDAFAMARPGSAAADVGRAVLALNRRRYDDAVAILWRDALSKEPDSEQVKSLLGVALQLAGRLHHSADFLEVADRAGPATRMPAPHCPDLSEVDANDD